MMACLHRQFPAITWFALANSYFAQLWVAYTVSFEGLLAPWGAGNFDQIRPADPDGGHKVSSVFT